MFPRAARFDRDKLSDTPGPNAYDPTEVVAHYKKGHLNQKDARFKSGQHPDSDDGASTSSVTPPRTSTTTPPRTITNAAALKEKARLTTRLTKAEERVASLERQVHSLTNEKSQSLADLRISQQQVEKLQAQVAKSKGQGSRSESVKITELQRSLYQCKQKEKVEAEKWTSKYFSLQHENTSLQHENTSLQQGKKHVESEWTKAKAAIALFKGEVQALQKRESDLLRQLEEERDGRRKAEESLADTTNRVKEQDTLCQELQNQQSSIARTLAEYQDEIEEGQDMLLEQSRQRTALETVASDQALLVSQLRSEKEQAQVDRSINEALLRRQRIMIEELEAEVIDSKVMVAYLEYDLRFERTCCQEAWLQVDEALSRRDTSDDLTATGSEDNIMSFAADEALRIFLDSSESLRMAGVIALQEEKDRCEELTGDMEELHARYLDALQEVKIVHETQRMLESVQQELESVEEAYEKSLLEAMRAHKAEEEVKRELNSCKADNDILTVKLRQTDKIGQKLANAKLKEEVWLQEREKLLQALETSRHFEAEYEQLRHQAQLWVSKSTLYQDQMEELSNLNTILASHTNPSQKIFYVDRIRKELDERRNECQLLAVERDQFKAVSKDLQVKLDLFCKVENRIEDRPKTAYRRVPRQHTNFSSSPTKTKAGTSGGVLMEKSPNKRSSIIRVRKQLSFEGG